MEMRLWSAAIRINYSPRSAGTPQAPRNQYRMLRAVLIPTRGKLIGSIPRRASPVLFLRRIAWWSGNLAMRQTQPAPTAPEPTPEERRIAAAYQREQEAMSAPTGIRSGGAAGSFSLGSGGSATIFRRR